MRCASGAAAPLVNAMRLTLGGCSMRRFIAFTAVVVTAASLSLLTSGANATTVGAAAGLKQGLAEINAVEKVVRVCRHRMFSSRRECYVDRSRPPTVCHHLRNSSRRDCY
jgi:hypothetical protein